MLGSINIRYTFYYYFQGMFKIYSHERQYKKTMYILNFMENLKLEKTTFQNLNLDITLCDILRIIVY